MDDASITVARVANAFAMRAGQTATAWPIRLRLFLLLLLLLLLL
jgi:hypothetical protein